MKFDPNKHNLKIQQLQQSLINTYFDDLKENFLANVLIQHPDLDLKDYSLCYRFTYDKSNFVTMRSTDVPLQTKSYTQVWLRPIEEEK